MVKKIIFAFILINLLGVLKVNAAQYNHDVFTAQLYDNRSGSLVASSTSDTGAAYYGVLSLTGYGSGGAWGVSSPTIILSNHTYVLTANVSLGSSNLALSSINRIGLGTTLDNARVSYQNNTYAEELYSRVVGTDLVQFAFKSSINASYIVFPFTSTTSTTSDIFLSYINFEDLGEGGLSQTDITNSLNSQTNNINSNSDRNRDAIINNQNETTENIINQGTASTYDSTRNNFDTTDKNCGFLYRYSTKKGVAYYSNGSSYTNPNSFGTEEYISLQGATKLVLTDFGSTATGQLIIYDSNKNYLDYWGVRDNTITLPSNAAYFRYATTIPTGHIFKDKGCTSKLDELNDSITSEDNPNTNQDINDMNGMVASDTPISDLITMPLTLINAYINGVNASCSPINLGNLYGTDLVLPCINLEQRLGSNLWHIIDAFFSIFMCYNIGMLFITAFDGITSLRDDFEGLYQPRHADTGYQPKHGG